MATGYYKPSPELEECNRLIEVYWNTKQYDKCFDGHLALAKQGYPLAECQVGYFYLKGLGFARTLNGHFTGHSVPHSMGTAMPNAIWHPFMRTESAHSAICSRQSTGMRRQLCKIRRLPCKSKRNWKIFDGSFRCLFKNWHSRLNLLCQFLCLIYKTGIKKIDRCPLGSGQ